MGFKSWINSARRFFRRRQNKSPSPIDMAAIRAQLHDEPVLRRSPLEKWPGFQARKQMTAIEFLEYVRTHPDMHPIIENRAAWKTVYEARLEILRDKQLSPHQKLQGMSGHDKEVALQAIALGKNDVFRSCVASQIIHTRNRIKEFSS